VLLLIREDKIHHEELRLEGSPVWERIPYFGECALGEDSAASIKLAWKENAGDANRISYINRQVFPQAPSPTMTSLRRISAMMMANLSRRCE
jgi:hypothetical protein